ncbi:MAG TPA: DUF1569 domain-containing protein [Bacteroidia bacterium]|nr:DUF1569 domain-containing protein [Bacteroidia bacterium]
MHAPYLFDKAEAEKFIARINTLHPASKSHWGKMSPSQMFFHCQKPLQVAFGEHTMKRSLIGMLFGKLAKKKLVDDKPFGKNLPTAPSFIVRHQPEFEEEKQKLITLIRRFSEGGPEKLSQQPHPFFGPMSTMEWSKSLWKHLDHHLRQFGA